ncbi:hypothetical protein O4H61_03820 [Roseovarius aestuarii]|nr:hypothetical protein [Roseovarius aestuarii]
MNMIFVTARAWLIVLSMGLALSACDKPEPQVGAVDRLSASYVEVQHRYNFAAKSGSLSSAERRAINSFLKRQALRNNDVIIVTIPTSGAPQTDAARRQTIRAALALVPSQVRIGMDENLAAFPTVRRQTGIIRVARPVGIRVDCEPGIADLGCASAINLAVMIHDPSDVLAAPQTATTASTTPQ